MSSGASQPRRRSARNHESFNQFMKKITGKNAPENPAVNSSPRKNNSLYPKDEETSSSGGASPALDEFDPPPPPVKRGRGRPRSNLAASDENSSSGCASPASQGQSSASSDQEGSEGRVAVKKTRGRPRKTPNVAVNIQPPRQYTRRTKEKSPSPEPVSFGNSTPNSEVAPEPVEEVAVEAEVVSQRSRESEEESSDDQLSEESSQESSQDDWTFEAAPSAPIMAPPSHSLITDVKTSTVQLSPTPKVAPSGGVSKILMVLGGFSGSQSRGRMEPVKSHDVIDLNRPGRSLETQLNVLQADIPVKPPESHKEFVEQNSGIPKPPIDEGKISARSPRKSAEPALQSPEKLQKVVEKNRSPTKKRAENKISENEKLPGRERVADVFAPSNEIKKEEDIEQESFEIVSETDHVDAFSEDILQHASISEEFPQAEFLEEMGLVAEEEIHAEAVEEVVETVAPVEEEMVFEETIQEEHKPEIETVEQTVQEEEFKPEIETAEEAVEIPCTAPPLEEETLAVIPEPENLPKEPEPEKLRELPIESVENVLEEKSSPSKTAAETSAEESQVEAEKISPKKSDEKSKASDVTPPKKSDSSRKDRQSPDRHREKEKKRHKEKKKHRHHSPERDRHRSKSSKSDKERHKESQSKSKDVESKTKEIEKPKQDEPKVKESEKSKAPKEKEKQKAKESPPKKPELPAVEAQAPKPKPPPQAKPVVKGQVSSRVKSQLESQLQSNSTATTDLIGQILNLGPTVSSTAPGPLKSKPKIDKPPPPKPEKPVLAKPDKPIPAPKPVQPAPKVEKPIVRQELTPPRVEKPIRPEPPVSKPESPPPAPAPLPPPSVFEIPPKDVRLPVSIPSISSLKEILAKTAKTSEKPDSNELPQPAQSSWNASQPAALPAKSAVDAIRRFVADEDSSDEDEPVKTMARPRPPPPPPQIPHAPPPTLPAVQNVVTPFSSIWSKLMPAVEPKPVEKVPSPEPQPSVENDKEDKPVEKEPEKSILTEDIPLPSPKKPEVEESSKESSPGPDADAESSSENEQSAAESTSLIQVKSTATAGKSIKLNLSNSSLKKIQESQEGKENVEPEEEPRVEEAWVGESVNVAEEVSNFSLVESNVYLCEKKRSKEGKLICDCTLPVEDKNNGVPGCGDSCLNRMLLIECGSRCPLGGNCTNNNFAKKRNAKVEVFRTHWKGLGLRAFEPIQKGSFIIEYVGEVISGQEFETRLTKMNAKGQTHFYFMGLKSNQFIDSLKKGNVSRFINHSCDPNAQTEKWTVGGDLRVGFFAKKDISAGEEITFDYQLQNYGREAQKCFCGTEKCRGVLGVTQKTLKGAEAAEPEIYTAEDDDFAEELDFLGQIGVKTRETALRVARLMVRADDWESRIFLLRLMDNTNAHLQKAYLEFGSLKIIVSWMQNYTPKTQPQAQGDETKTDDLREEVLSVLGGLNISHINYVEDSKIHSILEKWCGYSIEEIASAALELERAAAENKDGEKEGFKPAVTTSDSRSSHLKSVLKTSNEDEFFADKEGKAGLKERLAFRSIQLLNAWRSLPRLFRIPKVSKVDTGANESSSSSGNQSPAVGAPSVANLLNFKVGFTTTRKFERSRDQKKRLLQEAFENRRKRRVDHDEEWARMYAQYHGFEQVQEEEPEPEVWTLPHPSGEGVFVPDPANCPFCVPCGYCHPVIPVLKKCRYVEDGSDEEGPSEGQSDSDVWDEQIPVFCPPAMDEDVELDAEALAELKEDSDPIPELRSPLSLLQLKWWKMAKDSHERFYFWKGQQASKWKPPLKTHMMAEILADTENADHPREKRSKLVQEIPEPNYYEPPVQAGDNPEVVKITVDIEIQTENPPETAVAEVQTACVQDAADEVEMKRRRRKAELGEGEERVSSSSGQKRKHSSRERVVDKYEKRRLEKKAKKQKSSADPARPEFSSEASVDPSSKPELIDLEGGSHTPPLPHDPKPNSVDPKPTFGFGFEVTSAAADSSSNVAVLKPASDTSFEIPGLGIGGLAKKEEASSEEVAEANGVRKEMINKFKTDVNEYVYKNLNGLFVNMTPDDKKCLKKDIDFTAVAEKITMNVTSKEIKRRLTEKEMELNRNLKEAIKKYVKNYVNTKLMIDRAGHPHAHVHLHPHAPKVPHSSKSHHHKHP